MPLDVAMAVVQLYLVAAESGPTPVKAQTSPNLGPSIGLDHRSGLWPGKQRAAFG
ncbi:MAG: hypothetical protein ACRDTA_22335 [Pseudonocardiaceae bacterium]